MADHRDHFPAPDAKPKADPPDLKVVGDGEAATAPATAVNSYGEEVSALLPGRTHLDHLIQAADFIGFELFYCRFTQRVLVRRRDMEGDAPDEITALSDSILTTMWSEIIESCVVPKGAPKGGGRASGKGAEAGIEPAEFNLQVFRALAASFRDEAQSMFSRHARRVTNTALELLDEFAPLDDCTAEDAEFAQNWFLDEWGAKADGEVGRELVRHLSVRMGANIMDRIHNPGNALKMWPLIVGPANLGKSSFVRHLLPLSMDHFHSEVLSLKKEDDRITRKLSGKLLVEIPELAQAKGAEVERLKMVLDLGTREATILYQSWESKFLSTCAMIGTANPDNAILPASSDKALMLRLPMIEITSSPWGAEESVEAQMRNDNEALLRRLWRGWRRHYADGFDPTLQPPARLQAEIIRQASSHVYIDTGPTEVLEAVIDVARRLTKDIRESGNADDSHAADALGDEMAEIAKRGVLAANIDAFIRNRRTGSSIGSHPIPSLGRALAKDPNWVKVDPRPSARRWTCPAIASLFPKDMERGSIAAKAAELFVGEEAVASDRSGRPAAEVREEARRRFAELIPGEPTDDERDFQ